MFQQRHLSKQAMEQKKKKNASHPAVGKHPHKHNICCIDLYMNKGMEMSWVF